MVLSRCFVLVLGALLATACRTTTTSTPPGLAEAVVLRSYAARAWSVIDGAQRVGFVVRFEEPGTAGRSWFSIRNAYAQEVGIVGIDGRAWRYRPHQRDPEWLGSGTVQAGTIRILEVNSDASLVEIAVEAIGPAVRGESDEVERASPLLVPPVLPGDTSEKNSIQVPGHPEKV